MNLGMTTTQVGLRLQEENVEYIDTVVAAGRSKSRAAYVDRLLARERRRQQALEDREKMEAAGPDEDMEAMFAWLQAHPSDMSDLD
jgi:hypothetical protein